ncbi:MAG TPA: antibiotic biosynthesis monooxygenase [Ktedonobacterales bacterium]|nr:antibiotic biosynthesis monooxygenase [Ktedonobacterales bacterium]
MFARLTIVQAQADKIDETTSIFRDSIVPAAKAQKGYRGSYLLTDRTTGKGTSVTLWDSLEDLRASETSGYYQEQLAKLAPFFTSAPVTEVYEVASHD